MHEVAHAEHFESIEQQAHAARLGMWVFLASELLLFAGFFALYAAYRSLDPLAFERGIHENAKVLGSTNTAVLLLSSTLIACSVHSFRHEQRRASVVLATATIALGFAFLGIKAAEYTRHLHEGLVPRTHPFWALYYGMTGLHALHVMAGLTILGVLTVRIAQRTLDPHAPHAFELGAVYWHLVDVIWIFLWPLFYLG